MLDDMLALDKICPLVWVVALWLSRTRFHVSRRAYCTLLCAMFAVAHRRKHVSCLIFCKTPKNKSLEQESFPLK